MYRVLQPKCRLELEDRRLVFVFVGFINIIHSLMEL